MPRANTAKKPQSKKQAPSKKRTPKGGGKSLRDPLASTAPRDPLTASAPNDPLDERSSLTRSFVEKAQLALEGPAFGVPGLKWAVSVEGEREVEKEMLGGKPETTVSIGVEGGLRYDLWFLELGVDLTADLEVKVDGSLDTTEAVERGVSEFARWYAASRLGEVAVQRAALESSFNSTRTEILGAYKDLTQLLSDGAFKDFQNGAKSWFYFSMSPRTRVEMAINSFRNQIGAFFSVAKATGDQTRAALLFVDKDAILADFAKAADTTPKKARSNIDRSRGKVLSKFDPARAELLQAFDGLDTAKVLARDPEVEFSGTFGGNLSATKELGGEEDSLEVSMGAGMRIQSGDGDQFELGNQKVLRGKAALKLGDWGVEASGEREAGDPNAAKWTLGLGATREGKLTEGKHEIILDSAAVALSKHARSGTLANTSAIPDALEQLIGVVTDPTAQADKAVASGEVGGEVGIEGEVEFETTRKDDKSPWTFGDVSGSVSVSAMSGVKSSLELPTGKLGKIEGSADKGVKISKAIG